MNKIFTRDKEVERLATALAKGVLELNGMDYLPREPGERRRKPNPKNKGVICQFVENIKDTSPIAIASFRQQILEGEDIDEAGTCKSFKLMVARMHQIKMIAKAKTTLQGQDLIILALSNHKSNNTEEETTVCHKRKSPSQEMSRSGLESRALAGKPQRQGGLAPLEPSKLTCSRCGRKGHVSQSCFFRLHPDGNRENMTWVDSPQGKAWKALGEDCLPKDRILGGTPVPSDMD
jgi:hypothetical protein